MWSLALLVQALFTASGAIVASEPQGQASGVHRSTLIPDSGSAGYGSVGINYGGASFGGSSGLGGASGLGGGPGLSGGPGFGGGPGLSGGPGFGGGPGLSGGPGLGDTDDGLYGGGGLRGAGGLGGGALDLGSYGGRGPYGFGGAGGGGGRYGGEASSYYHHHDHHVDHHVKHSGHGKSAALKGLLIPLAGAALLGAAAALASNPILLQLGVITGRRRRREATSEEANRRLHDFALLEKFMASVPSDQSEQRLLASYLTCSSGDKGVQDCIQRLACELQRPGASQLDRQVMSIVKEDIIANKLIPESVKNAVNIAVDTGERNGKCEKFHCNILD